MSIDDSDLRQMAQALEKAIAANEAARARIVDKATAQILAAPSSQQVFFEPPERASPELSPAQCKQLLHAVQWFLEGGGKRHRAAFEPAKKRGVKPARDRNMQLASEIDILRSQDPPVTWEVIAEGRKMDVKSVREIHAEYLLPAVASKISAEVDATIDAERTRRREAAEAAVAGLISRQE